MVNLMNACKKHNLCSMRPKRAQFRPARLTAPQRGFQTGVSCRWSNLTADRGEAALRKIGSERRDGTEGRVMCSGSVRQVP